MLRCNAYPCARESRLTFALLHSNAACDLEMNAHHLPTASIYISQLENWKEEAHKILVFEEVTMLNGGGSLDKRGMDALLQERNPFRGCSFRPKAEPHWKAQGISTIGHKSPCLSQDLE